MSNETAIESLQEKIDDLNQQAWEVRVTDMPKAFELSKESVKLARNINYSKGLAEGLQSLGFSYLRFSKNDEAAPLLKESLSLFQSLNDLKGQAVVYEYLGIIERNWGNLGASLELLLKGNDLIQQIDPPEVEITSCYQIGVTYKHLGNHENALDYLYRALSLAKKISLTLMEAYATNIIGSIYFDNGNYHQALDCYQQGLIIRRLSNDKWGEAGSLDNIGFTYLKLNDLDKAIDHCKQSLAICQDTGDKKGEANALLHLGEIYKQAGDIKQAADFSNKSLEIRKERGDKRGETEVLLFLAELYKNRKDVEDHQIFEWLSDALKIADEVRAQDLLSKTYYDLHEYYQQKGNFKESLVQLEAHFQIEKELHKNSINQKIANLEISHKAEAISQRNKELTELNEKIEKANEEAQIQLALERVRARTMAMQHSDELKDAASLLFKQLEDLGVKSWSSGFNIWEDEGRSAIINMCNPDGSIATPYHLPHTEEIFFIKIDEARQRGDELLVMETGGKDLEQTYNYMFSLPEVKKMLGGMEDTGFQIPKFQVSHCAFFSQGYLMFITYEPVPKMWDVFKRLAKVFEQTYTRFLDLQKAEAQAREAKIETALEKVRSRTMAMHRSEELAETAEVLFKQLSELGNEPARISIGLPDEKAGTVNFWITDQSGQQIKTNYKGKLTEPTSISKIFNGWKAGQKSITIDLQGKEFENWVRYSREEIGAIVKNELLKNRRLHNVAYFSHGWLNMSSNEPISSESINLLERFASVFNLTYRRFLDLKNAEAQAREAQIELALERVRARTMAMQRSDELREAVLVIYEQLQQLNFESKACNIIIIDKKSGSAQYWVSGFLQEIFPESYAVPYLDHPYQDMLLKPWKQGDKYVVYEYTGKMKQSFDKIFFTQTEFRNVPEEAKKVMIGLESVILSTAFISYGALQVLGAEPLSEEKANILKRFAKVFEQTYTRFLDLQKAEAQARESQIETALERVRSRTMGMQKSDELKDVIQVVYEQFVHLNIHVEHTGFIMDYKQRNDMHIWLADKHAVPFQVTIPYFNCAHWNSFNEAKEKGMDFFANKLSFEEKNKFYQDLFKLIPDLPEETLKYYFSCPGLAISTVLLDNVGLYIENFSGIPYSDEENKTLMRFGKVFQQTYTRFLDLQKAEAQARESQIEAALEKVRSRTLAMQKSDELAETAAELFRQLIGLGIEPNRLYIGIVKDETGDMEMWATDEDGTQIGKRFMFNKNENASVLKLYDGWKTQKKSVIVDMQGKELEDYFHYLNNVMHIPFKGGLTQKRRVQSVAYFSKGFIGMASPDGQGNETIQLLERFAAVFNLTFTRFNDLKIAEAHAVQAKEDLVKLQTEKKRAEDALSELQVTQKQLIQSEKMASLGELTAGIAHEIQNPLNFVNNFSDVNKELLGEMKEEIEKGNIDEVIAIANDIISNEEKINHHGKRADAIVKGMLQHSRSSSGVKEPTDINELADEYLRLAYHGLRAKDKSFNATMKTDFDEAVGKIKVIPQEIGRVFLNLITNAFYVVAEKKKQLANGYEPTVTVTTKKENDKVVVSVKDNGSGIPQKDLDKIFQPFFTTKPTGQGTGLGLSLSYDIVKAHSGEIKVKTKDGEGSEFVISLPV